MEIVLENLMKGVGKGTKQNGDLDINQDYLDVNILGPLFKL